MVTLRSGLEVLAMSFFFTFLAFLGILTLLVGEMCAFSQKNIKRMLAYSSIGQIGLILFALAIATSHGVTGGLFQLVSHTLSKALLFLTAGYMIYQAGSMEISALEGMGRKMPLTCLAFTIGAFSLVGLPPFIGFPGKFLVVRAALATQETIFIVLISMALLGMVIEAAYFFRVIQVLYFRGGHYEESSNAAKREEPDPPAKDAPVTALAPMFIFVVLIVVVGVYPKLVTGVLNSAASELLNRLDYIGSVLG